MESDEISEFAAIEIKGTAEAPFVEVKLDSKEARPQLANGYSFKIQLSNPGIREEAVYNQYLSISYEFLNGSVCVNYDDGFYIHPDTFDEAEGNLESEIDRA